MGTRLHVLCPDDSTAITSCTGPRGLEIYSMTVSCGLIYFEIELYTVSGNAARTNTKESERYKSTPYFNTTIRYIQIDRILV